MRHEDGFSLIELLLSTTLMLTVTAAVFSLMNPTQGAFMVEPEVADMQQRMRVASDTLYKDLLMAGGGSYMGPSTGSLNYLLAPVMPFRYGLLNDDPPGTFRTDTITLLYVPSTNSQTTISQGMSAQSAHLEVNADPGCPQNDRLCGFAKGMNVLIYDDTGSYDEFTVSDVQESALHLQHSLNDLSKSYGAGAKIVQVASHTYYLKNDDATKTYQLMHYGGGNANDVPVVDHVVGLTFDYFGDPQPPIARKPVSDPTGPWTTYGPKPPSAGVRTTAWPAGENCVFTSDGSPTPAPRLPVLGAGGATTTLVKLTQEQLRDGPWCPDVTNRNRFDADLLRIRKIGVTLRVESAMVALRGPAGALFTHGGTSQSGNRFAPDQEVRFQVSPRNLNLGR